MSVPGVSVLWQVKTRFSAGYATPVYERGFFHLFYLRSGELRFRLADNSVEILRPGDVALFPPETPHGLSVPCGHDADGAEFKLLVTIPELLAALETCPIIFPISSNALLALQQMESYFGSAQISSANRGMMSGAVNAYASLLLYSIADACATQAVVPQNAVADIVEQYVREHYGEKILLDELVPLTGHNKSYTCALYKKERGYTINDYIKKYRINRACEMLIDGSFKISEIASVCGFKTAAHFSYTFKEVVGIPPSQFTTEEFNL